MKRIATATAQADKHGPDKPGFRDGVGAATLAPTRLNAEWFDHVQEEIAQTIELSGGSLSGSSYTQLFEAIRTAVSVYPVMGSLALRASDNSHTFDGLEAACFVPGGGPLGLGIFIAVGWSSADLLSYNEAIWSSYDGINWTQTSGSSFGRLYAIATSLGDVVVVGGGSGDNPVVGRMDVTGSAFTPIDITPLGALTTSGAGLRSVCWNANHSRFIACGKRVTAGLALMYGNADGSAWTLATPGSRFGGEFYKTIASSSRTFIFGTLGEIQSSDDGGATWTRRNTNGSLGTITSAVVVNSVIVCNTAQQRTMLRSADNGETWTEVYSPIELEALGVNDAVIEHVGRFDLMIFAVCKDAASGRRYIIGSLDGALTFPYVVRMPAIDVSGGATAQITGSATDGARPVMVGTTTAFGSALAFGSSVSAVASLA